MIEFDVQITGALLHRVMLRKLFRRWPLTLAAMALVGVGIYSELGRGHLGRFSVFGLTAIGLQLLFYTMYYVRQRQAIADWKRQQGDDPVHYQLTTESLTARSNLGSSELRWNAFRELIEYPDYLLLGFGRTAHFTLPRAGVPEEALEFIRERFASHQLPIKVG